jgi:hypothetical protein
MDYTSKTGSGKGQPSLGSGCPSTPAIGLHLGADRQRQKSPEDLSALRVERVAPRSLASAPVRTAIVTAMTSFLPSVVAAMVITTLIAIVVMPFVTRGDIHDRAARRDRAIDDDRFATRHRFADHDRRGRRARWRVNHDRTRRVKDWHGQPKIEADGNSCLGGAGQSENCNHCYQTEQMFCFHGRSDGAVGDLFDSRPLIKTEDD